jgi:hypothetical protein
VSGAILLDWPHVQNSNSTLSDAGHQGFAVHRLHAATRLMKPPRDLLDLEQPRLGKLPQCPEEGRDLLVGEVVGNMNAVLLCLDEARAPQHVKVVGRVGNRLADLRGKHLDRARRLTQEVENLQARSARKRLPDASELIVKGVLEGVG